MTLYRYVALGEKGKKIDGTIDAESLHDAKLKLIRRQILITSVKQAGSLKKKNRLKKSEVLNLTRECSRLLRAGLPLYETLSALEEKYLSHKAHELLLDLCDKIRSGVPFSEALAAHPDTFDILYCSMIANAEKSGDLPAALDELARLLERQLHLRKQLVGALLYPALLGSFCLIVLAILLYFVVPSLFELFEGRTLHPFTRFVFACSKFAIQAKWFLALFLCGMVGGAFWLSTSRKARIPVQKAVLRLPWMRELLAKVALARFFRASSSLIEGGLPALFALQQAGTTLNHPPLQSSIEEALRRLTEGAPLHESLRGRDMIPPLVPRMLGIAEEGGNLSSMMHQIASIYEEDLEQLLARFAQLAQPILLLVLGAMVGFVLLSVLLPLTDVSTFAM